MRKLLRIILQFFILLFWTLLMLSFSDLKMTALTITSALIHELGHILSLVILKKSFSLPRLVSSGFRIKTDAPLPYREEILVCACGPLINLIFFMFFMYEMPDFSVINLATAISNLLPLPGYDGYKILSDVIAIRKNDESVEKIMPHVTVFISALAVFLSLFLILHFNGGYWIFAVFFLVLLRKILFFQKDTKNEI